MNKGVLVAGLLLFFGIGFTSAYYGSFSSFSLSDLLSSIDSSTMLLGSVFIICFALIYFALGRFFKKADGTPNTTIAAVIGLVISLFIIYSLNQSGTDVQSVLFDLGISESITQTVVPFILIFGAIFLIWKLGIDYFFLIFGALFMIVGFFTDWVYERGMVAIIGFLLLVIGLWLHRRRARAAAGGGGRRGILGSLLHGTRRMVEGGTDRLQGAMDARSQRREQQQQVRRQQEDLTRDIMHIQRSINDIRHRLRDPRMNQRERVTLQQEILNLEGQQRQLEAQVRRLLGR